MDFNQHVECFRRLLENRRIVEFLKRDTCGALCDKYHLVIVFQFFMRAEFRKDDYNVRNFFLTLSLSHDLYDESKTLKHIILTYYLSCNDGSRCNTKAVFHWDKLLLFKRMRFKGFMEKRVCQKLCQLVRHKRLNRRRKEPHTGVISYSIFCDKCKCPVNETSSKQSDCNLKPKQPRKGGTEITGT